jgi:hypothetical protein
MTGEIIPKGEPGLGTALEKVVAPQPAPERDDR